MQYKLYCSVLMYVAIQFLAGECQAQETKRLPASTKYHKSKLYKTFWGEHYRKTWHTDITVPVAKLDTLKGGLTVYEMGGSRQTKSLKARDKDGREYVLRSVDKTFGGALPKNLRKTFIESLINDQVTISNPYSALVIAPLAEAAGILHTNPELYYIPKQPALDTFNEKAGDVLYMLEQRPDENWETAVNFANSKKIVSTEKMIEKTEEDNDNLVDQELFLRSRLFDLFINDWGRHDDQWRWAKVENGDKNIYKPIPRDRDNAFTKFDGLFVSTFKPSGLQSFEDNLKNASKFAFTGRNMDRRFLSSLDKQQWIDIAEDLQRRMTDEVIDSAIATLPPEVLPLLKDEYAAKLRSRRGHIREWAIDYYTFINSQGIDITGSGKKELFIIDNINENETIITAYKIKKDGETDSTPLYKRKFNRSETKEIRIFSLGGDDKYEFKGSDNGTKVIVVGTNDKETFTAESNTKYNTVIYDDKNNSIESPASFKAHLNDSPKYKYKYDYYRFDKKGLHPEIFYNREDLIYTGLAYSIMKYKWNKDPFWQRHLFAVRHSLDQGGFSFTYKGTFAKVFGNWNTNFVFNYDQMRWQNFFGLGNDTKLETYDEDYYRLRYKKLTFEPSIENKHSTWRAKIGAFVNKFIPVHDTDRYLFKTSPYNEPANSETKFFTGIYAEYVYQKLNDSIFPVKGFGVILNSTYIHPLTEKTKNAFVNTYATATLYIPLTKFAVIAMKAGASHFFGGTPEIYQYNTVGGTRTLRGYQRDRFTGSSTLFGQAELRLYTNVRSYLYSGKLGVFGFYDAGRAFWDEHEDSESWHTGYGAGILATPFDKITIFAAKGFSKEQTVTHLGIVRIF